MNTYELKKQARIERLRGRANKKLEFAQNNGLDLYGESKSGIPLGQPILVGHHSERKHRRALERIENRVRKGFEALEYSDELNRRADAAENNQAIDSDNPNALNLVKEKINKLSAWVDQAKRLNKIMSKFTNYDSCFDALNSKEEKTPDDIAIIEHLRGHTHPYGEKRMSWYYFSLTNTGAEIRRLKKRIVELEKVRAGFEPFEVMSHDGPIGVELVDGQIQVQFTFKPNEETRTKLKRSPLALKWSSYSKKWVRKHTSSTAVSWFKQVLIDVLKEAKKEVQS